MNFNGYPLKDELGEGLHKYERNTGRSAHLLVESIIEKYLIKTGILGSLDEEEIVDFPFDLIPTEEEVIPVNKNNFKKVNHGKYYNICYEDLNFGHHLHEYSDEIISKLAEQPYSRLVELSKNTVGAIPQYPSFLRESLINPTYTVEDHIKFFSKKKIRIHNSKGKKQIKIEGFSVGTFENEEDVEEVMSCLLNMDDLKIEELKEKLVNFKGKRKKYTLKFIRKYKELQ